VAGREADRSPAPSARVKNGWSFTSSPPIRLHCIGWNDFTVFTFTLLHSLVTVFDTQSLNMQ